MSKSIIILLLLLWACSATPAAKELVSRAVMQTPPPKDSLINYNLTLKKLTDSLKLNPNLMWVRIEKSRYLLSIMHDSMVVKTYPVVLGGNPTDDKLRQGDQCTPEGRFTMVSKYPHKGWRKFVWINYPTADSWRKHKQAKQQGTIPANADIGGEIGIHGVPDGTDYMIDQRINWTLGCISLKNTDIDEVYDMIQKNTVIEIVH